MGGTTSTTTKAPTTTTTTTTTATTLSTTAQASTSPQGLALQNQLLITCSSFLIILVLSVAIYIWWRKKSFSCLAGKEKAEPHDENKTVDDIKNEHAYANVGKPEKEVESNVIYTEVSIIKTGHSMTVVHPDTEYATVMAS